MPFKNLRDFLSYLEADGELQRVLPEVDPRWEIGAICRKSLDNDGPALFFEKVKNHVIPVIANLLATRKRYCMALETTPEELPRIWKNRLQMPLEPVIIKDGPCKENIILGDEVDLSRFPIPTWNALDGGPYITYPCQISKDPITGIRNASMYRSQVHGRNSLGILAAPYRHIMLQRAKAKKEPFPVAIVLGLDPAIHIAAVAAFPFGVDELAMAGALRGEPLALVPCETIPLEVPAEAEIVIEGEILPDTLQNEGPFGEFTGYYGSAGLRPVIAVKAITFRNNPLYLGTYIGRPPHEDCLLKGIPIETEIINSVSLPGIKKVHVTAGGAGAFNAIVAIDKQFEGYGKMVAMAVLGTWGGRFIKNLIIVDQDIDPFNPMEVEWALATRMQPDRDVEIIKSVTGVILDPSLPEEERLTGKSRTSKMIIDATKYDADRYEVECSPDPETMRRVESEWGKYGIRGRNVTT